MRAFNTPALQEIATAYGRKVATTYTPGSAFGVPLPSVSFALLDFLLSPLAAVFTLPEIRASRSEFADAEIIGDLLPAHIRAQ